MDESELRRRFPGLDVGVSPPRLFSINGLGLALCGSRDADPATGTYVKTHCFTIFWIPVFPLAAYRVADAEDGGWFVVGREPPNEAMRLARGIAAAVVLAATALITWGAHTASDSYRDGVELSGARAAAEAGRLGEAAGRFRGLAGSGRPVANAAREGLRSTVEALTPATDSVQARAILLAAHAPGGSSGPVLPDLWRRATAYVADPARLPVARQVEVLESLSALAPDADAMGAERRRLVERAAAASPPDVWAVSELALDLEARDDVAGAEALLSPHAKRLGDLEGARILGQIHAAQGRFEEAFPLLHSYVKGRLDRLHVEEEAFRKAAEGAERAALEELRGGRESADWYARHEASDEQAQMRMVTEAIRARVEKNPAFTASRKRFIEAARVVPVAMDLGIVLMQRARAMPDGVEARRELEEAGRVFTAIEGAAEGDPEFQFAAARVAFWLGRTDEFDARLDAALEAAGDTFEARARAATLVASLGEASGARVRWESAFEIATSREERSMAAFAVSAHIRDDPDEALAWIRKADAADPAVVAATAECEGRVALMRGDLAAAERAIAASLAAYDGLPRNSVTLNNAALAATQLSSLTGRVETLVDAGRRLRAALAEMPSNLVILTNAAQTLEALGWVRSMDGDLDLRFGVQNLKAFRHDDAGGLEAIRARARASEEMQEALLLLDRGLGLVPGNVDLLVARAGLAEELGDFARLRHLAGLLAATPPDREAAREAYLAWVIRAADPLPAKRVLDTVETRLEGLGPETDGRERAEVEIAYIEAASQASLLGVDVDVAALDARARRLHAEFPSSATRTVERTTAALLVHQALIASNARYARESRRSAASIGPEPLLCEALYRDRALREVVRERPDFARLADLIEEGGRKYPGELGGSSRGVLWLAGRRPLEEPDAFRNGEPDWALLGNIHHACSPFSARAAIIRAWELRIAGKATQADAVLEECARLGGKVPYLEE